MPQEAEREFMEAAIEASRKCESKDAAPGKTPPHVGVCVVSDGTPTVAFRGETADGRHAEFEALQIKLPESQLTRAVVYTTLEPCTHRSPKKVPCADRLASRKVSRVVIGMLDPNPRICGRGVLRLRSAGIAVELFLVDLQPVVEEVNRDFVRAVEKEAQKAPLPRDERADALLDEFIDTRTLARREIEKCLYQAGATADAMTALDNLNRLVEQCWHRLPGVYQHAKDVWRSLQTALNSTDVLALMGADAAYDVFRAAYRNVYGVKASTA